ncbi:MAG: 4-hydroxythreonine-4-phosphate dehydrogenase PdxA [Pseudomonadota bacterium]
MPRAPLVLTAGEPAGIGPDLCIQLAQAPPDVPLVVIADPDLLAQRAAQMGLPLGLRTYRSGTETGVRAGKLWVSPIPLPVASRPGQLDPDHASYVLACIRQAAEGCLAGEFAGLVTGPVHKANINDGGIRFTGHTEFLAEITGGHPVMMLSCPGLRVALVTTHIPLSQVPAAITAERLERVTRILHAELKLRFDIAEPRILVCGLNPHAGEDGHLGREELDVIRPTLVKLQDEGIHCLGPLPADTLFTPGNLQEADAVLAMYHDQGLPVLKHMGFGQAVNITLGLPIIRTSVDHGTALSLAGTGRADVGSLRAAVELAARIANRTAAAT